MMKPSRVPRKSGRPINLPDKYGHLPTVPRLCLLALEHFRLDAKAAAAYLGIPARSVVMYAELGRTKLEETARLQQG